MCRVVNDLIPCKLQGLTFSTLLAWLFVVVLLWRWHPVNGWRCSVSQNTRHWTCSGGWEGTPVGQTAREDEQLASVKLTFPPNRGRPSPGWQHTEYLLTNAKKFSFLLTYLQDNGCATHQGQAWFPFQCPVRVSSSLQQMPQGFRKRLGAGLNIQQ